MSEAPGHPARGALLLVLLVAAALTLPLLGARDLWAPDEPRYGQVAQEMLSGGHWWYPHVNDRPYPDKPPLYFWLAAAAGSAEGRVDEGAARLPSALAHLLLVALTFALGARLFGRSAGLVSALALSTLYLEAWMARRACLDVLLTLCATGAIACAVRAGDAAREARRGRFAALALLGGVATGLGFMTKGPVVLIAIAGAGLPLLLHGAAREGRPARTSAAGITLGALGLGLVLAAWLIPAHALGGYDPFAIAGEQVLDRAAEGRDHVQPAWYFLTSVPLDFMPWTLLAIPAFAWAWRRRERWPEVMLLGWALVPVAVHSFIVEKRNIYVLPAAPAWALLCGAWAAAQGTPSRFLRGATWGLAGALAVGGAAAAVAGGFLRAHGEVAEALALPGMRASIVGVGLAALVAAAWLALELRRGAGPVRLACTIALAFAVVESGLFLTLPRLDTLKSGRTMGEAVRRITRNAPLGMYPRTWDAYVYYSGRSIRDLQGDEGVARWLASVERPAYVLAYEKDLPELPKDGAAAPRTVFSDDVGHRTVCLLRYDNAAETP